MGSFTVHVHKQAAIMMDVSLPIYSHSLLSGDIASAARNATERGKALEAFLVDPAEACIVYAALKTDLITFFASSSNPYMEDCGKPEATYVERCEQWEAAHVWAVAHHEGPKARQAI
jgi:hypothetical protein